MRIYNLQNVTPVKFKGNWEGFWPYHSKSATALILDLLFSSTLFYIWPAHCSEYWWHLWGLGSSQVFATTWSIPLLADALFPWLLPMESAFLYRLYMSLMMSLVTSFFVYLLSIAQLNLIYSSWPNCEINAYMTLRYKKTCITHILWYK